MPEEQPSETDRARARTEAEEAVDSESPEPLALFWVYPRAIRGELFHPPRDETELGRRNDARWGTQTSGEHALLKSRCGGHELVLRANVSTNGTHINGVELDHGQSRVLKPGDRVRLGNTLGFVVRPTRAQTPRRFTVPRLSQNVPLLLLGETGVGKTRLARLVHQQSRPQGPFEIVNVTEIPTTLLETALFGHERGAFSGAVTRTTGALERAHGGTLFIDEIAELPLEQQSKLLQALGGGEFRRVGGAKAERSDFRLISATWRDLEERVEAGLFRADLYYRIKGQVVTMPPLRERELELDEFIDQFLGGAVSELTELARFWLKGRRWSGNIRELEHYTKALADTAPGSIDVESLGVDTRWLEELMAKHLASSVLAQPSFVNRQPHNVVAFDNEYSQLDPDKELDGRLLEALCEAGQRSERELRDYAKELHGLDRGDRQLQKRASLPDGAEGPAPCPASSGDLKQERDRMAHDPPALRALYLRIGSEDSGPRMGRLGRVAERVGLSRSQAGRDLASAFPELDRSDLANEFADLIEKQRAQ